MVTETLKESSSQGISPYCWECSKNNARAAADFAGMNHEETEKAVALAQATLEESKIKPLMVQHVTRRVADMIIEEKKLPPYYDIYREVKEISNKLALSYVDDVQKKIDESESPLELAFQIAAAGNIIDFGAKAYGSFDMDEELQNLENTIYDVYDFEELSESLQKAENLLILCDNCGEIVFDMLAIKIIKKQYPKLKITAAFRDKPVINDATVEDAISVGFDKLVPIISSGSVYPGTILEEISPEFRKVYDEADVIIAKGQGNFETLLPVKDSRIFFILRIKCDYMAELSGAGKNNLVLMKSPG